MLRQPVFIPTPPPPPICHAIETSAPPPSTIAYQHPRLCDNNMRSQHPPVRGGKRRAESTPFALVVMVRVMVKVRVRVMVRVSVIYHRDRVITGANGRCRLWSSLTNANGFMRTQIGAHLPTPPPPSRRP